MNRTYLHLLGKFALVFGLFGFIHPISPDNLVFGHYLVDTAMSIILIVVGVSAMAVAYFGLAVRWFTVGLGVLFAAMTTYAFIINQGEMLGFIGVNLADAELLLFVSLLTLHVGLFGDRYFARR